LPTIEGSVEEVADSVKRVWVVRDNKLVPVVIETGASNGTNTVVTKGLSVGDVVATGYTAEAVEEEESTDEGSESSPFAPKPPSSKKK
jgi:hypothetical protein